MREWKNREVEIVLCVKEMGREGKTREATNLLQFDQACSILPSAKPGFCWPSLKEVYSLCILLYQF